MFRAWNTPVRRSSSRLLGGKFRVGLLVLCLLAFGISSTLFAWTYRDRDPNRPTYRITGVTVEDAITYQVPDPIFPRNCGDLWPMTWADDDNIYTANGDGFAFGWMPTDIKVSRVYGTPPNMQGEAISFAWGNFLGRWWPPEWWKVSRKPTGMTCVHGKLYLFVQNLKNFLSDNEFGDAPAASISWSEDHGASWHYDRSAPMFDNHVFTTGFFLDYGKCNDYAFDGYVYVYGLDYNWRYSPGYRSTKLYLARVPQGQIVQRPAWRFFSGFEVDGTPTWSADINEKIPVLQDEDEFWGKTGISQGSVTYIPALNRYLYATWSDTAWIFYESKYPWGVWRRVSVVQWANIPWTEEFFGGYATVVPSKLLEPDGSGGWIVSSMLGAFNNDFYNLGMRRIFIESERP
jgi:hypothetical protein